MVVRKNVRDWWQLFTLGCPISGDFPLFLFFFLRRLRPLGFPTFRMFFSIGTIELSTKVLQNTSHKCFENVGRSVEEGGGGEKVGHECRYFICICQPSHFWRHIDKGFIPF